MQLDDLVYHIEEQGGYSVYATDYNEQYKIWTADHETYYLLDRGANSVTDLPKIQLQSWIDEGYLEPDDGTGENESSMDPDPGSNERLPGSIFTQTQADYIKPIFIGGSIIMIVYLLTRGK